jgi:DNA-directed RNA polymerase specialized sigma24 family protein
VTAVRLVPQREGCGVEPVRNLTTFYEFYRQHRPWSRSLMRRALAGTGSDREEHWNQAWAKFSQNYLNAAFVFKIGPEAYLRRILANQAIDASRRLVLGLEAAASDRQRDRRGVRHQRRDR